MTLGCMCVWGEGRRGAARDGEMPQVKGEVEDFMRVLFVGWPCYITTNVS